MHNATTMRPWQSQAPIHAEALSSRALQAQGELFVFQRRNVSPSRPSTLHWHESYEIGYFGCGAGQLVVGEQVYGFEAGQAYVVNTLEPHMCYAEGADAELLVVHFHTMLLDEGWIARNRPEVRLPFVSDAALQHPLLPATHPTNKHVGALLEQGHQLTQTRPPHWEVVAGGVLIQAVGLLAGAMAGERENTFETRRRRALRRIAASLRLIEERYREALRLEEIAAAAHLSRSQCCLLFEQAVGMSPVAYRNARRLTEAQRLLEASDRTVQSVAYEVGFSSPQALNRLFQQALGTTPSVFRTPASSVSSDDAFTP